MLPKVAEVILVIPHSNAELERLFSIVRKNKSLDRSSLTLDETLSSILATKTMYPESGPPRGGARWANCPGSPTQRGPQNWKDLAWVGFDQSVIIY